MATSTVTIDKAYFETLIRRAQFHTSGIDFTTPANLPMVTIPKVDHDNLLKIKSEYANLRRNLIHGGIDYETLAILTMDAPDVEQNEAMTNPSDVASDIGEFMSQNMHQFSESTFKSPPAGNAYANNRFVNYRQHRNGGYSSFGFTNHAHAFDDCTPPPEDDNEGFRKGTGDVFGQDQGFAFKKNAKRSIQLSNLPENSTHADVVGVIKGGLLLEIYLRDKDRSAVVSFLEENDAQDFFRYAKKNGIYIKDKWIDITWNDRQFTLISHVANKIAAGATRNLVVHSIGQHHTEESIRNDLDHIHNLVVIKVTFKDNNVRISTNSVHNSMYAKTCMMSRASYRGSKIQWEADECAVPIPKTQPAIQETVRKVQKDPKKKPSGKNRFELLNMDDEEDNHDVTDATLQTGVSSTILPFTV